MVKQKSSIFEHVVVLYIHPSVRTELFVQTTQVDQATLYQRWDVEKNENGMDMVYGAVRMKKMPFTWNIKLFLVFFTYNQARKQFFFSKRKTQASIIFTISSIFVCIIHIARGRFDPTTNFHRMTLWTSGQPKPAGNYSAYNNSRKIDLN